MKKYVKTLHAPRMVLRASNGGPLSYSQIDGNFLALEKTMDDLIKAINALGNNLPPMIQEALDRALSKEDAHSGSLKGLWRPYTFYQRGDLVQGKAGLYQAHYSHVSTWEDKQEFMESAQQQGESTQNDSPASDCGPSRWTFLGALDALDTDAMVMGA